MTDRPDLSSLDFDQIKDLQQSIDAAVDAGAALTCHGLFPSFSLVPGADIVIRIGARMPGLFGPQTGPIYAPLFPSVPPMQTSAKGAAVAESPAVRDVAAPVAAGHPDPVSDPRPEAAPDDHAGDTESAEDAPPVPEAGEPPAANRTAAGDQKAEAWAHIEAQIMATPVSPAPLPGSASALAASNLMLPAWTEEDDARAIAAAVGWLLGGSSKTTAYAAAAEAVNRTHRATEQRLRKLWTRVEEALDRARDPEPLDPPPAPVVAPVPADPPPAVLRTAAVEPLPVADYQTPPAGVAEAPDPDPLEAHLAAVPRPGNWTLGRDHNLMELAELQWPMNDIALELRVTVKDLQARFAVLTDNRRFKRAEVLAALTRMLLAEVEAEGEAAA